MPNPGGNYPGRQIFLGRVNDLPAFVYVVTGRSASSKMRYASPFLPENAIRIKPVDTNEPFDPFRHYHAVRIDPKTGLLVVPNSQAPNDAVQEAYSFMPDHEKCSGTFLEELLAAIGPEYDSMEKPTSRIVGVAFPLDGDFGQTLAITSQKRMAHQIYPFQTTNMLAFVQTYNGDVDYRNFDLANLPTEKSMLFNPVGRTSQELADELFEITDYIDPKYGDLRVCAVAGVRNGNGPGGWDIARRNVHNVE